MADITATKRIETIHDEWHRTEDNIKMLTEMIRAAYQLSDCDQVLIAHHLCFTKSGVCYELASAETFLFDPIAAIALYGQVSASELADLANTPPLKRLERAYKKWKGNQATAELKKPTPTDAVSYPYFAVIGLALIATFVVDNYLLP